MMREQGLSRTERDLKLAEWEGYKRLAKRLEDHHVLAVQLIRTSNDQTAAVFTIVKNHEPFQTVVMGDARGRVNPKDCHVRLTPTGEPHFAAEARLAAAAPMGAGPGGGDDLGDVSPDAMAVGDPPIKQPPTPGMIALAGSLLSVAFDTGEHGPAK